MNSTPIISQTKLNVLQERVCSPISYLCTKIDSATPLWDGPIKMCQTIMDDQFAVDTVVMEAKKRNDAFNGVNTPRLYQAILCRVYIILYYLHHDDQLYQEIVFPRLKENMGVYNDVHLKTINEQIDKILAQEELMKKVLIEKRKDSKPLFAYDSLTGNELDYLFIEYNEEKLFRDMAEIIKGLSDKYGTHQDEANVWYNAKKVVRTLRDVSRPELLIRRAASALVAGQMYNEFAGSQIVLICAYAMVSSSNYNSHFDPFIQEMEGLSDADTDLLVIKESIVDIKNWIYRNLPFDNYDYIGEKTTDTENYTSADIEQIRKQIVEQEKVERDILLIKVEELEASEKALKQQVSSLKMELETEKAKKKAEPEDESEIIKSLKNDLVAFKTQDKKGKDISLFTAKQVAIILKALFLEHKSLTNNAKKLAPLLQRFGGGWASTTAENALGYEVTQEECDEIEMIFHDYAPAIGRIIKDYPMKFKELKEKKLQNNLKM